VNPTSYPTPTPDDATICFSSTASVELEDGSNKAMSDLSVGDKVLVGRGNKQEFQPIYGFGHRDSDHMAEFLQVYTSAKRQSPLELSRDHLLFLSNATTPVPASTIQVGDSIQGKSGSLKVIKLRTIKRYGMYAPFTQDGTMIVDGILASSFVTFQEGQAYMTIGGVNIGWSYHTLSVFWNKPYQFYCTQLSANFCRDQTYVQGGITMWSSVGKSIVSFMFDSEDHATGILLQALIFLVVMPFVLLANAVVFVAGHFMPLIVAACVILLSMMTMKKLASSFASRSTKVKVL